MTVVTVVSETDGPPVHGGREAPLPATQRPRPRLRLRFVRTTARAISWYARRDPRLAPDASPRNADMPMTMTTTMTMTSAGTAS